MFEQSEIKGIMGTYGYISIIAMVCYGFMLLMFLTAKRNKIVNSFLVVLVGLLFWAGGSAFMRVHLWPSYEFWYQVSLLGILLLPYAYYCFILAFGGVKKGLPGKIYLAVMLICFVVNIRHGVFLGCPNVVEKNGLPTFVYEIKPTILYSFPGWDFFDLSFPYPCADLQSKSQYESTV